MPAITSSELLHGLKRPDCYPYPVRRVKAIDLGSAWVLLSGPYAYKLGKPLPAVLADCSSLLARRHAQEEELRLNQRLAPDTYVDLVEFRGSLSAPRIGGPGAIVDHAIRLRQFRRAEVAHRMLARGELTPELVERIAHRIARFHQSIRSDQKPAFAAPGRVYRRTLRVLEEIERLSQRGEERHTIAAVRAWIDAEFVRRSHDLQQRWESFMVREGHGDLRLEKLVRVNGELAPIDCCGDPRQRWRDVMSDLAMLMVDLLDRSEPELALTALNAYLETSGDYAGLTVLRYHIVERALQRARLHLVHARRAEPGSARETRYLRRFSRSVALAKAQIASQPRPLVATHGITDSERSAAATAIARELQAITLRYDAELARARGAQEPSCDVQRTPHRIYETLARSALYALRAGYPVVIDAPCLLRAERAALHDAARAAGAPLVIVAVETPERLLRAAWMAEFAAADPVKFDMRLLRLEQELSTRERIASEEGLEVVEAHTDRPLTHKALQNIRRAAGVPAIDTHVEDTAQRAEPVVS